MSFTEIKTQEQFDAAIKDRLERQEKSINEKYASQIAELTERAKGYEDLQTSYKALEDSSKGYNSTIEELNTKLKDAEGKLETANLNAMKQKVVIEKGLPLEMVNRLVGNNEEEIAADADAVVSMFGTREHAYKKTTEDVSKDSEREALREMLHKMKGAE